MTLLRSLRTPGWRRSVLVRRMLAAVLLLLAVLLAVRQSGSTDPRTVVFTRALTAGETVSRDDVTVVPVPTHLLPATALRDPADVEGLVLAAGAAEGEVATKLRFVEMNLTEAFVGEITTLVPVRLAEPEILPLLHHGDSVTILAGGSDRAESEVIATGGRVILADTRESPGTLLVGLSEQDAHAVAAASLSAPLAVVLTPHLPN